MIRQTVRSLALAAVCLSLAGGAWAQVLRQSTSTPAVVALEYFGAAGGREIQSAGFDVDADPADRTSTVRPYVALTVNNGPITTGNVAEITFTLTGATLSQSVSPANLDLRSSCTDAATQSGLSVSVSGGGAQEDASVTFRTEVTAGGGLADGQAICFWVPNLQATLANLAPPGSPPSMGVAVTATIEQGVTNQNAFPGRISGPVGGDVDANDDEDALDGNEVGSSPNAPGRVFSAMPALLTMLEPGGEALVSLKDRTKISRGVADPSVKESAKAPMGLSVGALSIATAPAAASGIWQLNGTANVVGANGAIDASLGGQVMLSVGGPFQDGDKVVFGKAPSAREVMAEGMMASTALELKPGRTTIVYVPSGTNLLEPSTFVAMARYAFNSSDNNSALAIKPTSGEVKYDGIEVEGYAYGVVKGDGMDMSYGRATCEAPSGECEMYVQCTGQDGTPYFGGPMKVGSGQTAVISSDDLAMALGGGWETGRGRCEIFSTAPLAFQHMVRSGHTLVNNSVVVGRGIDENVDDGIQAVVDRICASVGTGDGQQDGADNGEGGTFDTDVDTACMPVDTMMPPSS